VVELGAGLGHLTAALLDLGCHVIAVERDRDMAAALRDHFGSEPKLQLLEANAATLDLATLSPQGTPLTIVGNLPYQLSSAILFRMLDQRALVRRLIFLLQAEFVERMAAPSGGRDYGVLSIQAQALAQVTPLFDVPASAFHPRPSVDSMVVELVPLAQPRVDAALAPLFTRVVRGAFQQRRKTLSNALTNAGLTRAKEALQLTHIDGQRRAETLDIEDFVRLATALQTLGASEPAAAPDEP